MSEKRRGKILLVVILFNRQKTIHQQFNRRDEILKALGLRREVGGNGANQFQSNSEQSSPKLKTRKRNNFVFGRYSAGNRQQLNRRDEILNLLGTRAKQGDNQHSGSELNSRPKTTEDIAQEIGISNGGNIIQPPENNPPTLKKAVMIYEML